MTAAELEQFLNDLATKLTPAGQQVFDMAVRNQIIVALTYLAVVIILGVVFLFAAIPVRALARHQDEVLQTYLDKHDQYRADDLIPAALIRWGYFVVAGGVWLVGLLVWLLIDLPVLLNPQWYALKDILSQVPGK
jgi:multisubunit Na+/H+ antiporter MnhB subunit